MKLTREAIVEMAKKAGAETAYYGIECTEGMKFYNHEDLEDFAAEVIEMCAKVCEGKHISVDSGDIFAERIRALSPKKGE